MAEKKNLPEPDKRGFYHTFNQMGFMLNELDPYVSDFLVKAPSPLLDIGCAFGKSSLYALHLGKEVIANDISEDHLLALDSQVKQEHKSLITYKVGKFPSEINFEEGTIGSVLASRVFHFLTEEEITLGCKNIYRWLKKDGLFCITSETPNRKNLKDFLSVIQRRKDEGKKFPAYVDDVKRYWPNDYKNLPEWINFLDEEIANRVLEQEGFKIVFSKSYIRVIEVDSMLGNLPNFFITIGQKID